MLFQMAFYGQQIPPEFGIGCETFNPSINPYPTIDNSSCTAINLWDRRFDELFMPNSNSSTANLTVNFIFLQRDDGTGNFQEGNSEHQALIDDVIISLNATYSNLVDTDDPNCNPNTHSFISDAKVSFNVNRIYIEDSYGWNNNGGNLCPGGDSWYLDYLDDAIVDDPNYERGINIYFTEGYDNYFNLVVNQSTTSNNGIGKSCSQFPSTTNFSRTSRVHVPDIFTKYWHMKNICPGLYNEPWNPVIRGVVRFNSKQGYCS